MPLQEIIMSREDAAKIDASNVRQLFDQFADVLNYREMLWNQYDKQNEITTALMSPDDYTVLAPIARYATNIAAGYFIGKPCKYYSRITQSAKALELPNGKRVTITDKDNDEMDDKTRADVEAYMRSLRAILRRNHEDDENMALARDALIHRVAFERVYTIKTADGGVDIRIKNIDPKKCVLIKDTSIERRPVAFLCREEFADPFTSRSVFRYEVITDASHRFYEFDGTAISGQIPHGVESEAGKPLREYDADVNTLNLERLVGIPIVEYRMPENKGFFEDCIPLMNARDALLQNMRNTFKYNDEAIMLMIGYMKPESDEKMEELHKQIETWKMMFLGEDNKIEWLLKDVPIDSIVGYYNILSQDIFAMLGIKNPVKQSEVYQNITTVRYQNYGMENTIIGMERTFERSLLEGRAQMITKILNFLGKTDWDWELLDVAFERNLPTSRTEEAQFIAQMKNADVLADADILDQVSFVEDTDAAVERKRAQDEREAREAAEAALAASRRVNPYTVDKNDDVNNDRRLDKADGRIQQSR